LRGIVAGAASAATGLAVTGAAIAQIAGGVSHPQPDSGCTQVNLAAGGFSLDPRGCSA
jgi:hypothetical protein